MRQRITSFGTIKYAELEKMLYSVNIFGFTATETANVIIYHYKVFFRDNKKAPEKLDIYVSRNSKNVINIISDRKAFKNIDEFIDRMIIKKER